MLAPSRQETLDALKYFKYMTMTGTDQKGNWQGKNEHFETLKKVAQAYLILTESEEE